MKITAIIDENIISETQKLTGSATITEAITKALQEWIAAYHIKNLNAQVSKKPLELADANAIREANRAQ
ncbi:hypothetical protein AGMMS50229_09040 [Campylobacterota bacterium]|nr:hypothetical protein AGMMS50229_09040 [Campylobacterota bacterium]